MKCGCLVKREMRGKKKPRLAVVKSIIRKWRKFAEETPNPPKHLQIDDDMEVCDGTILVTIDTQIESGSMYSEQCNCYASFLVHYKCNKCGNDCYPELPNHEGDLSAFVQAVIEQLTEQQAEKFVEIDRLNEEDNRKMTATFIGNKKSSKKDDLKRTKSNREILNGIVARQKEKFSKLSFQ